MPRSSLVRCFSLSLCLFSCPFLVCPPSPQTPSNPPISPFTDPAINGTLNVLKSAQTYNPTLSRIVITASFASILDYTKGERPGYTYTEADWNPSTYAEAAVAPTGAAYGASKALAERAAWDYMASEKPAFGLTILCPPMVYGPAVHQIESLQNMNTSSADIYRLCNGSLKEVPETRVYAWVDVRDIAELHARAYETEEAAGQRFLCAEGRFTYQKICGRSLLLSPGATAVFGLLLYCVFGP